MQVTTFPYQNIYKLFKETDLNRLHKKSQYKFLFAVSCLLQEYMFRQ